MRFFRSLSAWLLIFATAGVLSPSSAQKGDEAFELWRVRSQTITDDLLKDAGDLNSLRLCFGPD